MVSLDVPVMLCRATNAIDGWPTYQKAYLLDKLLEDEAAFKTEVRPTRKRKRDKGRG